MRLFIIAVCLCSTLYTQAQINQLTGLEDLKIIQGDLIISKTKLTSLDALSNLEQVGGDVIIKNNLQLEDFCGLAHLLEQGKIGGQVVIKGNLNNPSPADICAKTALSTSKPLSQIPLAIYPNPVQDWLQWSTEGGENQEFSLVDALGRTVQTGTTQQGRLHIAALPKGMYTLYIQTGEDVQHSQFVKE